MNSNRISLKTTPQTSPCCAPSSGEIIGPLIEGQATEKEIPGEVLLKIPGLLERPVIGGGCCAYVASEAIAQEISLLKDIEIATPMPGPENEYIRVRGVINHTTLKAIHDAVKCFDYEVESGELVKPD